MNNNPEKTVSLIQDASKLTGVRLKTPEILTDELPIRVSLIGQPQQNLFGILNEFSEYTKDLNRPLYRSFQCKISYGEEKITISRDGEVVETTATELTQVLLQFNNAAEPVLCEIQLPCESLKNITLQVISSGKDYADIAWEQILMESDYCYFVLTSTALLSMCERKVLRNYLLPQMSEQLGILTVNDHLILSADRKEIEEALERFFKGQVPIYSTTQDDFTLLGELKKLVPCVENFRRARSNRGAQICLKKAVHQLDMQMQILSEDSDALEDALAILEEKARALPAHMKTASRRARMQYTSQMRLDITGQISNFYQALKEQLQEDITKRSDIAELQEALPGYIVSQWENKVTQLQSYIEQQVSQMQSGLDSYIENDIRSYIENGVDMDVADYIFCLTNMYGSRDVISQVPAFEFEEKTNILKSLFSSGETTLVTAVVGMLILSHPLLGAGAALVGIQKQRKKMLAENRQGLLEAADKMNKEIFDQVIIQLDSMVKSLEDNLNTAVETCYQKIMDTMVQALTSRKHDQNNYADRLEQLNITKSEMVMLLQ